MALEVPLSELRVEVTPAQYQALKQLANTGRYGERVQDVIAYFICRGLQDMVGTGEIKR